MINDSYTPSTPTPSSMIVMTVIGGPVPWLSSHHLDFFILCKKMTTLKTNNALYKPDIIQVVLLYRRCQPSRLYSRPHHPSARAHCCRTGRRRTAPCPRRSPSDTPIPLCDSEFRTEYNVWK